MGIGIDIGIIKDNIDVASDISVKKVDNLLLKGVPIENAKSLRTHAKKDKGHWILVHDTKKVISFEYTERGTIYSKHTILNGTEEEMKTQIKNLKLIQEEV